MDFEFLSPKFKIAIQFQVLKWRFLIFSRIQIFQKPKFQIWQNRFLHFHPISIQNFDFSGSIYKKLPRMQKTSSLSTRNFCSPNFSSTVCPHVCHHRVCLNVCALASTPAHGFTLITTFAFFIAVTLPTRRLFLLVRGGIGGTRAGAMGCSLIRCRVSCSLSGHMTRTVTAMVARLIWLLVVAQT